MFSPILLHIQHSRFKIQYKAHTIYIYIGNIVGDKRHRNMFNRPTSPRKFWSHHLVVSPLYNFQHPWPAAPKLGISDLGGYKILVRWPSSCCSCNYHQLIEGIKSIHSLAVSLACGKLNDGKTMIDPQNSIVTPLFLFLCSIYSSVNEKKRNGSTHLKGTRLDVFVQVL